MKNNLSNNKSYASNKSPISGIISKIYVSEGKRVDTGEIIGVERFGMSDNETVESLSLKTYDSLFNLYVSTLSYINDKKKITCFQSVVEKKAL